jgi:hypothetical protein
VKKVFTRYRSRHIRRPGFGWVAIPRDSHHRPDGRPQRACCATAAAMRWRTPAMTPGLFKRGWVTRTSSTQYVIRSWRRIGSGISGGIRLITCGSRDWLGVHKHPDAAALKLYGEAIWRVYGPLV